MNINFYNQFDSDKNKFTLMLLIKFALHTYKTKTPTLISYFTNNYYSDISNQLLMLYLLECLCSLIILWIKFTTEDTGCVESYSANTMHEYPKEFCGR